MPQYHNVHFCEITLNVLYSQIEQIIDAFQSEFATYFYNLFQKMAKYVILLKKYQIKLIFEVKHHSNDFVNPI